MKHITVFFYGPKQFSLKMKSIYKIICYDKNEHFVYPLKFFIFIYYVLGGYTTRIGFVNRILNITNSVNISVI